jgi:hypothetical protein
MNVLENYYIQRCYLRNNIIREHTIKKINPLFQMAVNIESRDQLNNSDNGTPLPNDTVSH